jgi:hypothetical protein
MTTSTHPPTPDAWRARATHLRELATQTEDDFVRGQLAELADTWEELADRASRNTAEIIRLHKK